MHVSALTPAVLADLRRPRPYPAISLVMRTHPRRGVDEDRVRLKNLLSEARARLSADPRVGREERLELQARLEETEVLGRDDVFLHAGAGLQILLAPGEETQVWQLDGEEDVPTRVEFAPTFLTRYLVAARERSAPYWVLVLGLDTCRLYQGSAGRLFEVEEHGFPAEPAIPDPEDALPGPVTDFPSPARDERIQQYMRAVDEKLAAPLAARRQPLFLVGGTKLLAEFDGVSRHADRVDGRLDLVGLDEVSPAVLAERLEPVLSGFRERQTHRALQDLDDARGRKQYAAGLQDVWVAVADRRVHLLVLEEGLRAAGTVAEDGRGLRLVPLPDGPGLTDGGGEQAPDGVVTDLVDTLVENALDADASVRFVPDGTLNERGRVVAALRY
ncbi:hypothetical protein [Streptomyces sp. NPDC001744]|uniref:baeRF3 domain-containing protein n=1 Tax=Streptomyces sp. NPDC001744 TaxID=3364606 RepID=UPI0036A805EE